MRKSEWSVPFKIGSRMYGDSRTYVIAEIGTNHGADLSRAKNLISACAEAGVDAVKFQSWSAAKLQSRYERSTVGTLVDSSVLGVLLKYQLPDAWHGELAEYCRACNVDFLSTPFDPERAELLRRLEVPAIKIASGDLTYRELLEVVGGYDVPVLLSTGMGNLGEIEQALAWLQADQRQDIVLLHCVGAYPPSLQDANLLAIRTLREAFGRPVGFSDHYPGYETVLGAVALGAGVIEKHVTFSRNDGHPDSPFALEVNELRDMVAAIRGLEMAMGSGTKRCMQSEAGGLTGGRRGLYAARDIQAGEVVQREDIEVVRPNAGKLQPHDLPRVLGARTRAEIEAGTALGWEHFELG